MNPRPRPVTILLADSDPQDRSLCQAAIAEAQIIARLDWVASGEDLFRYLCDQQQPLPGLILLALKLPNKDGHSVLRMLKQDPRLRRIPVVVLTHANEKEDISSTYQLGGSGHIAKPKHFDLLVSIMKSIDQYWFHIVTPPSW